LLVSYGSPAFTTGFIESEMDKLSANWQQLPNFDQIVFDTPYTNDEIFELQIESVNDVAFITHKNHRPRVLKRLYADFWSFEPIVFDFAPALDVDISTNVVQIQYDSPEWAPNISYSIGDRVGVTSGTYSTLSAISAVGLFTCNTAHTSTSGAAASTGKPGSTTGSWNNYWNRGTNSTKYNKWAADVAYKIGQVVWYNKRLYKCRLGHTSDDAFYSADIFDTVGVNTPTKGKKWKNYWSLAGSSTDLSDLRYKLVSEQDIFTTGSVGETWQIRVPVDNYYSRLRLRLTSATATLEPSEEIFLQGQMLVSSRWDIGAAPIGTYYLEESLDGVTWNAIQLFTVESSKDNNISYTYEAPTKGAWYRLSGQRYGTAAATEGARTLVLEPANAILTVPFLISEYVDANTVKGYPTFNNNQALPDKAVGVSTSYYKRPAFSASTGYPSSVALHESRLWFGGVATQPTRVWGSQKDEFYNFLLGTNVSDALDLTLQAKVSSRIRWMKSFNRQLVVATDGEVYTIDAGDSDASINPTTIRGRVRLYNGGCDIPGVVTTDSLLYFQNGNKRLREFAYNFQTDSFVAPDMSLLADHINGSGFVQCAMMKNPDPVLWSINKSGELLGFSYDRAQNVTAWHRHTTGGRRLSAFAGLNASTDKFISVTTIPGQNKSADEIWFVVNRTDGDGLQYYNLERFDQFVLNYIYGANSGYGSTNLTYGEYDNIGALRYGYLDGYCQSFTRLEGVIPSGPSIGQRVTAYCFTNLTDVNINSGYKTNLGFYKRNVYAVYTTGQNVSAGPVYFSGSISGLFAEYPYKFTLPFDDNMNQDGAQDLPQAVVGLPVYSLYIPTRFDIKLDNGTSMGRKHRINRVEFKPWRTVGGKYVSLDSFRSTLSGGRGLELLPTYDTPANNISYQDFNFNITPDDQSIMYYANTNVSYNGTATLSARPWLQTYSGSTADTSINSNWTENPLFAVVHYDAAPFNLLGMVWKMEVQGN